MNFAFLVADLVSILRVGSKSHLSSINVQVHKYTSIILTLLYIEGFVARFRKLSLRQYRVDLKYHNGRAIITSVKIISNPSKRMYCNLAKLTLLVNNSNFSGFYILSTSKGLLTSDDCLFRYHVSGEIVLKIEF